ncbi:MAG: type II toxin-antitoxin system VapC family toxin [Aridibacter sp.]
MGGSTRPKDVNGLGMSTEECEVQLDRLQKLFRVLPENKEIFESWQELVIKYKVSGKVTHDARIVATMITHKVENILTLNPKDFKRFTEITAYKPQDILNK